MVWTEVLLGAGLDVLPLDPEHVRLQTPVGPMTMRLQHRPRPVSSSQLPSAPARNTLLHVPRISEKTMRTAEASGWSVVTDDGHLSLLLENGSRIRRQPMSSNAAAARRSPGPPQYGRFAVVRRLLEDGPQRQTRLASEVGISQSRVSRILMPLWERALLKRTPNGWAPTDWDALCDWFLSTYPGPGGVATYWYSLDPAPVAAGAAVDAARAAETRAGLSGDVAADLVLPWRRPHHAVVYAERGVDLTAAGFTPAISPQDATLTLVVPKDRGVWPPRPWTPDPAHPHIELADPLQVLYDQHTAPGPDADQAADRWRSALRTRTLPGLLSISGAGSKA